jgi:hypothetical protein
MKRTTARFFGALLALAWPALQPLAAGTTSVIEGRLTRVTTSFVQVDHGQTYQFNSAIAQCFDFRGDSIACDTLVGIGYVDRARLTVRGSDVLRIDIVELHQ